MTNARAPVHLHLTGDLSPVPRRRPPPNRPGYLKLNLPPCWHKPGCGRSITKACAPSTPTRACPLLQPESALLPFCTPSGTRRTIGSLRPKSRAAVEIQHWPAPTHPPSKDRKEAIMFKHPHYEPRVSRRGSLSIKGFNRWRRRGGDTERVSKGGGRRETGDCSFSLLIGALTPTGCSSITDPERKWVNPMKLERGNRLRRLLSTPSISLLSFPSFPSLILFCATPLCPRFHFTSLQNLISGPRFIPTQQRSCPF